MKCQGKARVNEIRKEFFGSPSQRQVTAKLAEAHVRKRGIQDALPQVPEDHPESTDRQNASESF